MKRTAVWIVLLSAGLALSGCSLKGPGGQAPRSAGEAGSKYRFSLQNVEGQTVTLDGLLANHKAVLLNFWATWCPFCVEEIPDLVKLQDKFSGRSFTVAGIDAGESRDDVTSYLGHHPVNYPILLDRDMAVSETYGVVGLPTTMLIRSDGKVIDVYHSVTPKLEADIEALLA